MNIKENFYIMFAKNKITLINWVKNIAHIVPPNNYYYYFYYRKIYNHEVFPKKIDGWMDR